MRYRLAHGQRSARYRPGQWVSAAYFFRYPEKVELVPTTAAEERFLREELRAARARPRRPPTPAPPVVVPAEAPEVWEVTVIYDAEDGDVQDITIHLTARAPRKWTPEEVRAAFWALHKQGPPLREWIVEGIDWRSGRRLYSYPSARVSLAEALENMGGIVNTVGLAGVRVGRVEA